jgi:transketolase
MDNKTPMRDAFFDRLYELVSEDKRIVIVSADMGAPSLDKFRKDFSNHYINTGVAEQNAILIATGLALSGKRPYVYAITPFVTNRVHEFLKLEMGAMKVPITIVGIGTGYSYDDSGPTHHTVEDISIMRPIPNLEIYSPSDSIMSRKIAEITSKSNSPGYVRIDRKTSKIKYDLKEDFKEGFKELRKGKDLCLVATGNMVDKALEITSIKSKEDIGVVDLYRIKPLNSEFIDTISKYKKIISLEEHFLIGGLGSLISEIITDNDLDVKLKRVGVDNKYHYEYGGREYIQDKMEIGRKSILNKIEQF